MKKIVIALAVLLAGCSSPAQKCESLKADFSAKALYAHRHMTGGAHPVQYAQAAKREKVYNAEGLQLIIKADNTVYVNGKPAAIIEQAEKATVYQQGLYNFTVYKNGRVAVMKDGVFDCWMKKIK